MISVLCSERSRYPLFFWCRKNQFLCVLSSCVSEKWWGQPETPWSWKENVKLHRGAAPLDLLFLRIISIVVNVPLFLCCRFTLKGLDRPGWMLCKSDDSKWRPLPRSKSGTRLMGLWWTYSGHELTREECRIRCVATCWESHCRPIYFAPTQATLHPEKQEDDWLLNSERMSVVIVSTPHFLT